MLFETCQSHYRGQGISIACRTVFIKKVLMPVTKGAERRWSAKKFILKLEKFRALFWLGGGGEHNKDQVDQKKKKKICIFQLQSV